MLRTGDDQDDARGRSEGDEPGGEIRQAGRRRLHAGEPVEGAGHAHPVHRVIGGDDRDVHLVPQRPNGDRRRRDDARLEGFRLSLIHI